MAEIQPNIGASFKACEEIVEGVMAQAAAEDSMALFDTAALAHLMAALQLLVMRNLSVLDVHMLIEGLAPMLVPAEESPEEEPRIYTKP